MLTNPIFLLVLAILLVLASVVGFRVGRRVLRPAKAPRAAPVAPTSTEIAPDDPDRQFYNQCIAAGLHWLGDWSPDQVRRHAATRPYLLGDELLFARIPETPADRLLRLPGKTCRQRCDNLACDHRVFDLYVADRYLPQDRSSLKLGPCMLARVCGHCGRRQSVPADEVGPPSPRVTWEAPVLREVGVFHYLATLAARRGTQAHTQSSASPAP